MSEVKLNITDREGTTHRLNATAGDNLMHVLRDNVDLTIGICGGEISCGTCLVRLNAEYADRLPPAGEDETEMIEAMGAESNARLACQIVLDDATDGLQATILHEE